MSNKPNTVPLSSHKIVSLLAQKFIQEYEDVMKNYDLPQQLEITDHLLNMLQFIEQYAQNQDEAIYKLYVEQEEALLKKYRKTLTPYTHKQFHTYFHFDIVLHEKNIYSEEAFNNLTGEQQGLTLNEISGFVQICSNTLNNAKTFIYLQMEPEDGLIGSSTETATTGLPEADKEITKARQLLAIYYLLKAGFGIEHRNSHSVSTVARFAHLMTGTPFTNLQNSEIYKKYSLMPNYNKGEQLITDLKFIRSYFEQLHIDKAVQLIDEEIQREINELPIAIRKKYMDNGK